MYPPMEQPVGDFCKHRQRCFCVKICFARDDSGKLPACIIHKVALTDADGQEYIQAYQGVSTALCKEVEYNFCMKNEIQTLSDGSEIKIVLQKVDCPDCETYTFVQHAGQWEEIKASKQTKQKPKRRCGNK